jgi:type IV secretory pathway VirB10-like protein
MPETPDSPRQIVDTRKAPPGVMPRHIQTWVLVGITALMIVVLIFTGPAPAPAPRTVANPALATVDPSVSKIQEYQRQVDEQTKRLAAERAELELTKRALTSTASTGQQTPQTETQAPTERPAADPMQQERAQREVRSRYADPIVLTTRPAASNLAGPRDSTSARSSEGSSTSPRALSSPAGTAGDDPGTRPGADRKFQLPEGTIIESVLVNELKGVFTGPVNTMVSTPVYSMDGQQLLIPAGSRLLGEAHPVATTGQTRLAVTFHRLEIPDRPPVSLDRFVGLNQEGDAGLADQVNHHYFQVFGASIALGALGGLAQANSDYGIDRSGVDAYRQGVASSFGQSSAHILDQYLNRPADVTIGVGHRVRVYLSKDLELPEYVPTTPASAGTRRPS